MKNNVVSLDTAKKLPGMETYLVYPDGRIYSTVTRMFLKPYLNGKPGRQYPTVRLQQDGVKKTYKVHRLVASLFTPNPDNLPEVNHKDGNKLNPHVDNLEWVTVSGNRRHAYATGLDSKAGERNGNSRLTAVEVGRIRSLKGTVKATTLASLFGVTNDHITAIWRNEKWQTL